MSFEYKKKIKDFSQYLTPPSNEQELKYLIIELIYKDYISFPIDSNSLYRTIKKMFKFVEFSIFMFKRLDFQQVIQDMIENSCFDIEEISICNRKSFYIKTVNLSQLWAFYQKLPNSVNNDYNSIVNNEKYVQISKGYMLDYISKNSKKKGLDKFKSMISDTYEYNNNYNNTHHEDEEFSQNIMNDIFFKPSAKALLNYNEGIHEKDDRSFSKKGLRPFCPYGTRSECNRKNKRRIKCEMVHFVPVIKPHTDVNLGDCSYLDTCRHMDICKFVHYEIENSELLPSNRKELVLSGYNGSLPSQWINCDIRHFDISVLGDFQVIMADPPWDIHMDLPYGTLSDEEMKNIKINDLMKDGVIFLWVTGRATELARECLDLWGYERKEELVWIKTNQLQRLIRTGRTGHWLNHSKEHCLIGIKGNPKIYRNIDCDVLVSEVRETSRKPDEIYELIERICPNGRKIELFARPHNRRHGWVSLGNQLPGAYIVEDDVIERFNLKYPSQKLVKEEMEINRIKSIETKEV